ncbi:MAG: hypothetical protein CVU98_01700 [Firmicutes bacterium HGW-Firmicutes-3]|jgi:hypothetical protein|nr:MAG: hypothetical protein CVU98_01700 [Firmicutes bacterium HGW-Firmicutes-3]
MSKYKELVEELKTVISGKTMDALVPPLLFVLLNGRFDLGLASLMATTSALIISTFRFLSKQNWHYAFGGLLGVIIASGFSFFSGNASNYFLPGILSNVLLLILCLLSLMVGKPIAAWASHLSRGWSLDWFWRTDVKPAYTNVTWIWSLFILVRVLILLMLFVSDQPTQLFIWNTILGWPLTIGILLTSYIYGIWKLKRLGGPGIEEFTSGKMPPFQGQTRGF